MSKHDFSVLEFEARRARLRSAMEAGGLDWLICFHPVSVHWLTGAEAKSYQEFQCLLVAARPGPIVVLTREGERNEFIADALVDRLETWGGPEPEDPLDGFARLVAELGLGGCRVGMEVPAYYLHPHHYHRIRELLGSALVAEPTTLVHDLTLVKSPAELAYIREAAAIADIGVAALSDALAPGRSELSLAGAIIGATMAAGSGIPASPINLVTGPRTAFSHGAPTRRILQPGDFGNVEFGTTSHRYTATIGRQFVLGRPSERMRELYDVVREAADAMIEVIRDGVPAVVPHEAAKAVIAKAGLDHGRVHTSGYGLAPGFPPTWGEPLHMFGGSGYVLEAGMVVTVEPPVFLGEEGLGARLIDNVLVTRTGAELLARSSRDLIVVE